ncbi:hypothetical protein [Nitrincola iocasae]|uniref:Phosphodiesterase n=1 Tax=Nitrincola iocasae TaxID=2614693 RepID=A0A5J6LFC2_9GAMM|nr:hypothetical protein [Nitrincola iocasae]QEW07264.1 hypothetical protein F5I99_12550 [Nitrincola iocasae]
MNKLNFTGMLGLLLLALFSGPVAAEVLTINQFQPEVRPGDQMFVNGLSEQAVLGRFGEPVRKVAPVGQPPISRWVYDEFTVYFEYQTALHAVIHRKNPRVTD